MLVFMIGITQATDSCHGLSLLSSSAELFENFSVPVAADVLQSSA